MNKRALLSVVTALAFSAAASPGQAHHAFAAQFDASRPIRLIGRITNVEWRNPHTWFYIEVEDDDGNVSDWGWELASPNLLMRNGWTRRTMEVGTVVTVEGFLSRDGSNTANARSIIINETGQSLFTGSNAPGE